ncbi:MAG: hypothetical protein E7299_10090 [Lachnospiraceae bacterium]|nr:hypothetical protein [Lachnospiraceae bacterium]
MSENDRSYIQDEIDQLETEIDRVAETTKFNETYLLKGDKNADAEKALSYKKGTVTFAEGTTAVYTADGKALDEAAAAEYLSEDPDATLYKTAAGAGKIAVEDTHYTYEEGTDPQGTAAKDIYYTTAAPDADGETSTKIDSGASAADILNTAADAFTKNAYVVSGTQTITPGGSNGSETSGAADVYVLDTTANTVIKVTAGTGISDTDAHAIFAKDGTLKDAKYKIVEAATFGTAVTGASAGTDSTAAFKAPTTKLYKADGTEITTPAALKTAIEDEIALYETAPSDEAGDTEFTADIPATAPAFYDENGNWISENALTDYFEVGEGDAITQIEGKKVYDKDGNELTLTADQITESFAAPEELVGGLVLKLHVGADATDNNQISVKLDAMSAAGIGVDGLKVDGADDTNARKAIETIKAALQKVSTQRSALGAVQNRLEHTIANLDNVVENTTAAESQIRDTDMASEMVKYSNNNILAQAGTSMLAQANQANQNILSLLG